MSFNNTTPSGTIGVGLLCLLAALPLVLADRPQDSQRDEHASKNERSGSVGPAPRSEPARAPAQPAPRAVAARAPEERRPAAVDRVSHGTIRHVDSQAIQQPVAVQRAPVANQRIVGHRDVEVDIDHSRYWSGFEYGRRVGSLRSGCRRIFVNQTPYFYDDGLYYQQSGNEYQEIYPPIGAVVPELPDGAVEVQAGDTIYYYAGGAFYVQQGDGFAVASPPMGVVVPEPPPGAAAVNINGSIVYQFNGVYYQPVFVNGVTQYMTSLP